MKGMGQWSRELGVTALISLGLLAMGGTAWSQYPAHQCWGQYQLDNAGNVKTGWYRLGDIDYQIPDPKDPVSWVETVTNNARKQCFEEAKQSCDYARGSP